MLQKTDSPVPSLLFFGGPYGNLQALTALRSIAEDLNIRGAVAGFVPFDALYNVTYPSEPQPHVKVELTSYVNKDLYVTGQFLVQHLDHRHVASLANRRTIPAPDNLFAVLRVEVWELRRWMILLTVPLRIYLKWKVKTEVRKMGEFVARKRGRPSCEWGRILNVLRKDHLGFKETRRKNNLIGRYVLSTLNLFVLSQLFVGCAPTGSSTRPSLTAEQFNRARWEEIIAQAAGVSSAIT